IRQAVPGNGDGKPSNESLFQVPRFSAPRTNLVVLRQLRSSIRRLARDREAATQTASARQTFCDVKTLQGWRLMTTPTVDLFRGFSALKLDVWHVFVGNQQPWFVALCGQRFLPPPCYTAVPTGAPICSSCDKNYDAMLTMRAKEKTLTGRDA